MVRRATARVQYLIVRVTVVDRFIINELVQRFRGQRTTVTMEFPSYCFSVFRQRPIFAV